MIGWLRRAVSALRVENRGLSTLTSFHLHSAFTVLELPLQCYCQHIIMTASPEREGSPTNLDELFDYDVGLEDIFGNNNSNADQTNSKPQTGDPSSLGLDEEVKVTKKRQPIAKLDDNR